MLGERLSSLVSFESLKLAAGVLLLSPYVPLLFMGEEYGESSPFLYFVDHSDPALIESVRKGRTKEFESFRFAGEPPDPQAEGTFHQSKIDWKKREAGKQRILLNYYKELVRLRKEIPALTNLSKDELLVRSLERERVLITERWKDGSRVLSFFNFGPKERTLEISIPEGRWRRIADSCEKRWNGPGPTLPSRIPAEGGIRIREYSFAAYLREEVS
jgi:maltooligosyltrehalose trehalohydrolase